MIDTIPRPDASLPEFLAARARHSSDGRLATDAIAGVVAAILIAIWRGPWSETLLAFAIAVAMFGIWGIADRELSERVDARRSARLALRAVRVLSAIVGFAAGALLLMTLLAASLGRIIS